MLTLNFLKDEENVVYAPEAEIVPQLAADLLIPNLDETIERFRQSPVKEGLILKGGRRSSVKLFIPDLYFSQHIDMGENVWLYLGEMSPAYCVYQPWDETEE
jgi:hypothetical protein